MLQHSRNIKYRLSRGYSLVELIIVVTLISLLLSATLYQLRGSISNVSPDTVATDLALQIYKVKQRATSGATNVSIRTVDVTTAVIKPHYGVTISTTPILGTNNCSNSNCYPQNSICISGQSFCFTPSNTITFDRFSGNTQNPDVVFITSSNRKLALLITGSGDFYVAEQIKGNWYSKSQLQNLDQQIGGK